jgi:hypothetical protein
MTSAWRPVVAALANETVRAAYARIVLGDPDPFAGLSPSRAERVREALIRAGLVVERDGGLVADGVVLQRMLATAAPRPTGVARFLRPDGRIDRYPANAADRDALLRSVASAVLQPGEVVAEPELNDRLAAHADDVALLRRRLVDAGILERTRSGSAYALPADRPPAAPSEPAPGSFLR